jgi:hypothetical protein
MRILPPYVIYKKRKKPLEEINHSQQNTTYNACGLLLLGKLLEFCAHHVLLLDERLDAPLVLQQVEGARNFAEAQSHAGQFCKQ